MVIVNGEPETDQAERRGGAEPGVDKMPEVGHARRDGSPQLPGRVGTEIVECGPVDGDHPHVPVESENLLRPSDDLLETRRGAPGERRGERVRREIHRQPRSLVVVESRQHGEQRLDRRAVCRAIGVHHEGHQVEVDTVEERRQLRRRHCALADPQHQRADAFGEPDQDGAIRLCRRRPVCGVDLGHLPAGFDVAQCVAATHERPTARQRGFGEIVPARVERPDGETVVRRRVEQTLRLGAQLGGVLLRCLRQHARHGGAPSVQIGVDYTCGSAVAGFLHSHQAK